jgi:hypothetical protein
VSLPDNQLNALQRKLELHDAELKEAHRHIAALKGKLLKLKEYRRELKQLKRGKATSIFASKSDARIISSFTLLSQNFTGMRRMMTNKTPAAMRFCDSVGRMFWSAILITIQIFLANAPISR